MYRSVEYTDEDSSSPQALLFTSEVGEDGNQEHLFLTFQALANRMETLGLESAEQALEYIGKESFEPEVADTLHEGVQSAYGEVVQSEYAQSLMPQPPQQESSRQTMMAPARISQDKRGKLEAERSRVLQTLSMRSVVHSEPAARMMDSSRPTERTTPAAATALRAEEGVIAKAVTLIQEHSNVLQGWRIETVCSYVPQLRTQLEKEAKND